MNDTSISRRKILLGTTALLASAALPPNASAADTSGAVVSGGAAVDSIDAGALQSRIGGTVIARDSASYDIWRQTMVWNTAKPSRRPEAIVQVSSVSDIQAVVDYARGKG